jgi:hypothetical protein
MSVLGPARRPGSASRAVAPPGPGGKRDGAADPERNVAGKQERTKSGKRERTKSGKRERTK